MGEVGCGLIEGSLEDQRCWRLRVRDVDGGAGALDFHLGLVLHHGHVALPHSVVFRLNAGDLDPAVNILVVGEVLEPSTLSLQVGIQGILSPIRCGPATGPDLGGGLADQSHVLLILTDLRIRINDGRPVISDKMSYPVNILRRCEVEGENTASEAEQESFTQHVVLMCHLGLSYWRTGPTTLRLLGCCWVV